ncbi:hypothetical protein M2244_001651 [Rhodoferax antarcticus]|nr:hypothetical protein [Rhodoferax antarcticus]
MHYFCVVTKEGGLGRVAKRLDKAVPTGRASWP